MLLPLQKSIIYGPVNSRRYGRSLGINLMPSRFKLCSFNCVYCQYGLTSVCTTDMAPHTADMPSMKQVTAALEEKLRTPMELDLITFSGNGEPTLHPEFPRIVDEVVRLRNAHKPRAKVALLSNSTGLGSEAVRQSLAKIDLPIMKLDAGRDATFRAVNRPAGQVRFDTIVRGLKSVQNICLQSVFIDGTPANTGSEDLAAWIALVKDIQPREVHIYSIDRPTPNAAIALVSPLRLDDIADYTFLGTNVKVRAFYSTRLAFQA